MAIKRKDSRLRAREKTGLQDKEKLNNLDWASYDPVQIFLVGYTKLIYCVLHKAWSLKGMRKMQLKKLINDQRFAKHTRTIKK